MPSTKKHQNHTQDLFNKIKKSINGSLEKDPEFKKILAQLTQSTRSAQSPQSKEKTKANILKAVRTNDFSTIEYPKRSKKYNSVIRLACIRVKLLASAIEKAFKNNSKTNISHEEKTTILHLLKMIQIINEIYIKWRSELYPQKLLQRLNSSKTPKSILEKIGLDDPYAIIQFENSSYKNVPYCLAFPREYKDLTKTINSLIKGFKNHKNTHLLAYLKSYKTAINCSESKKDKKGEWLSVKLWKEVDTKWLKCDGKIQFAHGIEYAYTKEIDPAGIKIIPELKLPLIVTRPDTAKSIEKMKNENSKVLGKLTKLNLNQLKTSSVEMISMICEGGNALENPGIAQMGPNFTDIQQSYGVKSYIESEEELGEEATGDKITKYIFANENYKRDWTLKKAADYNHYFADYIGGHELGHIILGGNIEKIEEAKATWVAMTAIFERTKQKKLSKKVAEQLMKELIKSSFRYLLEIESDEYGLEGRIDCKLFLETELMSKRPDGKYDFNKDKIERTYKKIEETLFEFIKLYGTKKYKKWLKQLLDFGKYKSSVEDLITLAKKGSKS